MNDRPRIAWHERLRSPLTWHYAGLVLLVILVSFLAVRFALDWSITDSSSAGALAGKQFQLKALQIETAPLRGLDKQVAVTREEVKDFYAKRVPANYSSIASRIGDLEVKSGVRLSRVQYAQGPAGADLTEITMDAGISGAYPQIMHFVNDLERDPMFFVIRTMALTGQQGGMVNLRLRVSTWLRPADAAASGLPPSKDESPGAPSAPGKEGQ